MPKKYIISAFLIILIFYIFHKARLVDFDKHHQSSNSLLPEGIEKTSNSPSALSENDVIARDSSQSTSDKTPPSYKEFNHLSDDDIMMYSSVVSYRSAVIFKNLFEGLGVKEQNFLNRELAVFGANLHELCRPNVSRDPFRDNPDEGVFAFRVAPYAGGDRLKAEMMNRIANKLGSDLVAKLSDVLNPGAFGCMGEVEMLIQFHLDELGQMSWYAETLMSGKPISSRKAYSFQDFVKRYGPIVEFDDEF